MPGIAGFICRRRLNIEDKERLSTMTDSLLHSESYITGHFIAEEFGVGVGWTCHPGSYSDCMPITNETKDVLIFFSGEHFADATDISRLKANGHVFDDSNASYLAHLYEDSGEDFVEQLNGTFSGLLVDIRRKRVTLFNDRFGLGRVYVHENANGIYFSSEAKSLLFAFPNLRSLDNRSLGEFLSCGCTLGGRTLFDGIGLLPPASCWNAGIGSQPERKRYFEMSSWDRGESLTPEAYFQSLTSIFNRIAPRYFSGRQKIALSLTGGLDSRMIIAAMADQPETLPCYTFGGLYRDCADVRLARQIAALCRQPYSVISIGDGFIREYPDLARRCVYLTDGTMDVSGAVGLYANRLAREIAPVRMTGNYGSEILRHHVAFKPKEVNLKAFAPDLAVHVANATVTYQGEKSARSPLSFITEIQLPFHHYARLAEEQSRLVIRAPYLDHELVSLAYRAPAGELLNKQLAYRYTGERCPILSGFPTDRGSLARPKLIPNRLFTFTKEFLPRLEYAFDYGMPNWLAKVDHLLAALHLERLILGQQKYYFFRLWYRDQLAPFLKETLLDERTLALPFLDRKGVVKAVEEHCKGIANHTTLLHKLLTLVFMNDTLLRPLGPNVDRSPQTSFSKN